MEPSKTCYFIGGSRDLSKQVMDEAGYDRLFFPFFRDGPTPTSREPATLAGSRPVAYKVETYERLGRCDLGWIYVVAT